MSKIVERLIDFIDKSPTPYHAVSNLEKMLMTAKFIRLEEGDSWDLKDKLGYYIIRDDSSIIAFRLNRKNYIETGIKMVGAHTDSPALKVKPNVELKSNNTLQFAVEPYGGMLLNTWFDRDLSLAGRVVGEDGAGKLKSVLVNLATPIATVPSVAIHLDRKANENRSINKQSDLPPLICNIEDGEDISFEKIILKETNGELKNMLGHDLFFYDSQKGAQTGLNQEFISSARLDNLLSCFIAIDALINSDEKQSSMVICNDHEECGSSSNVGADGSFLLKTLQRLLLSDEELYGRVISNSFLISADNAHAIHPNHPELHEKNHTPLINKGPVIKINSNQRYTSNAMTSAFFKSLCKKEGVSFQEFVVRSDMGCGSTIGPITSSLLGVKSVDIGLPTLAMHSIRELAGVNDVGNLSKVFMRFFLN